MNAVPIPDDAQALLSRTDWSRGPLGAADGWPQSLRTAVDIVIHSPMPMLFAVGTATDADLQQRVRPARRAEASAGVRSADP